eukprot:11935471-Ditylum_brightwellii.AAC.2
MAFTLNPYTADLKLGNKDDKKLFAEATKGLGKKQKFDGRKESLPDFSKLIGYLIQEFRLKDILKMAIKWNNAAIVQDPSKFKNIFQTNAATQEKVKEHVALVWSNTGHGVDIPKYFEVYEGSLPGDTTALMAKRNARKIKHLMLNKLL